MAFHAPYGNPDPDGYSRLVVEIPEINYMPIRDADTPPARLLRLYSRVCVVRGMGLRETFLPGFTSSSGPYHGQFTTTA